MTSVPTDNFSKDLPGPAPPGGVRPNPNNRVMLIKFLYTTGYNCIHF